MQNLNDKEIDRLHIDILRDTTKDVSDTIRAMDRKIFFLTSRIVFMPSIFIAVLVYIFNIKESPELDILIKVLIFATIVLTPFILSFIPLIKAVLPLVNPLESLKIKEDMKFSENSFFVFTHKRKFALNELLSNVNELNDANKIKSALLKQLVVLSTIRDKKIIQFKKSFNFFVIGLVIEIIMLILVVLVKYFL